VGGRNLSPKRTTTGRKKGKKMSWQQSQHQKHLEHAIATKNTKAWQPPPEQHFTYMHPSYMQRVGLHRDVETDRKPGEMNPTRIPVYVSNPTSEPVEWYLFDGEPRQVNAGRVGRGETARIYVERGDVIKIV
jgi:hypothetical protein